MTRRDGRYPRFVVEDRDTDNPHVYIHCSVCDRRIRELGRDETVRVDILHLCDNCDPGVDVPNVRHSIQLSDKDG